MKFRFINYWRSKYKVNCLIQIEHIKLYNQIAYRHTFYFVILNLGFNISGKSKNLNK